ncbi:MAG: cupin domain-containing protein [Prolixibacteraceae bacterium]|jgi:transcriptional regulator with XRE-family HTH domain|nr:cupin domain-containing protein [Prolixibacteraceae bacterium]
MKRLGERIKKKREFLRIPMGELARRAGISASALSQIEKAKAFPSVVTLKNIADKLNITVGELIGENEDLSRNPLMKESDQKFVDKNSSGSELYLLSHHDVHKQMETFLIRFVNESNAEGFFGNHQGQAFCIVQSGEFLFTLDGQKYQMTAGDSFYFNTVLPYSVHLHKGDSGALVWIVTPPVGAIKE